MPVMHHATVAERSFLLFGAATGSGPRVKCINYDEDGPFERSCAAAVLQRRTRTPTYSVPQMARRQPYTRR